MDSVSVSLLGGSGYAGGELLRLLHFHPNIKIQQVTSERYAGKPVAAVHPNLRSISDLRFSSQETVGPCDVLFACLPHGSFEKRFDHFRSLAGRIIDLSADFRIGGREGFVYGIPELHREEMRNATRISSAGCNATAVILALYPLFKEEAVRRDMVVAEVKAGSSEGGNQVSEASHHPIRSGAVRSFKPTGHRHVLEMKQELCFGGDITIHFSATAVEMVRGVLATCHVFLTSDLSEKDIWKIFRSAYGGEPFIRLVKSSTGAYRYPEPKILSGTNYCDIGFERDPDSGRLVVISAIDNLMKGAAGQAVQALNIMHGWDETTGLVFPGLHPV